MKNLQLNFIYSWHEAKLRKAGLEKISRYHKFRFILGIKFYLIGFIAVFLFCLAPALYSLYGLKTFSDAEEAGYNQYAVARCRWFEIPHNYTLPKSNSALCNCVKLATPLEVRMTHLRIFHLFIRFALRTEMQPSSHALQQWGAFAALQVTPSRRLNNHGAMLA